MDKKHIPLVVGGAAAAVLLAASVCCCGGSAYFWPASTAVRNEEPLKADETRDGDAELEVLPPLRTGMTREQAKGILQKGTLKEWKVMTPEGHLAICRLAARRLHPSGDEELISSRARNFVMMLDEMSYSGKHSEGEKIGGMIAFENTLYHSAEKEEGSKP